MFSCSWIRGSLIRLAAVALVLTGARAAEMVAAGSSYPNAFYQSVNLIYPLEESGDTISYSAIGAGAGICRILDYDTCTSHAMPHHIDFSCGEALIKAQEYLDYPDVQMYPTVAGAIVPVINIPELQGRELVLDTVALAQIFRANITHWDDDRIKATQTPAVAAVLPHAAIQVAVRSGSKGTTEVFKTALAGFEEEFRLQVGTSSSDVWNGVSIQTAKSIGGLAGYVKSTPYTIGYVGSFDANLVNLSFPALSRNGVLIRCNEESVRSALFEVGLNFGNLGDSPEHLTVELLKAEGANAWPISSFTYLLLRKNTLRDGATCDTRRAVMAYWDWFYTSAAVEEVARQYEFAPLPSAVRDVVLGRLRTDLLCEGVQVYEPIVKPTVKVSAPLFMEAFFGILVNPAYTKGINTDIEIEYSVDSGGGFTPADTVLLHRSADVISDTAVSFPFGLYGVGVLYNLCGREGCGYESSPIVALTPAVIAGILSGSIRKWNHPEIVVHNSFLSTLDQNITVYVAPEISTDMVALTAILVSKFSNFEINRDVVITVNAGVVKSYLYAIPYALAVTALVQTDLEGAARIADVVNDDGVAIRASESSLGACLDPEQSQSCYPLTDILVLSTVRDYDSGCGENGLSRQKVELVKWLLSASSFVSAYGAYPLSSAGATLDNALNIITCKGTSILQIVEDKTEIPASLSTAIRVVAGLFLFLLLLCCVGVYAFRTSKSINNSQPEFMVVLLFGLMMMTMSMFFMDIQDTNAVDSFAGPDEACMEQVWFYAVGFSIVIAALVAKAVRIKWILNNATNMKREKVHASDMIPLVCGLVSVEFVILIVWQIVSPLKFERIIDETDEQTGETTLSHGVCTSELALPFLFALLLVKTVVCLYGNIVAFQINQPGNSIGESRLLSMTMLSCIQSFIVAVPLCYLLRDDPSTLYVVKSMSVLFAVIVVGGVMVFSKFFDLSIKTVVKKVKVYNESRGSSIGQSSLNETSQAPTSFPSKTAMVPIRETDENA